MIASLLVLLLGIVASNPLLESGLSLIVPGYAIGSSAVLGMLSNIICAIINLFVMFFPLVPMDSLEKGQDMVLCIYGMYLAINHIFRNYTLLSIVAVFAEIAIVLLSAVLTLNVKFRIIFGSLVASYFISYYATIIMRTTSFMIFIVQMVIFAGIFVILGKLNYKIFFSSVKGLMSPFLLLVTINIFLGTPFKALHAEQYGPAKIISFIYMGIFIPVFFLLSYFREEIRNRYLLFMANRAKNNIAASAE
jgi:hypothetical protein